MHKIVKVKRRLLATSEAAKDSTAKFTRATDPNRSSSNRSVFGSSSKLINLSKAEKETLAKMAVEKIVELLEKSCVTPSEKKSSVSTATTVSNCNDDLSTDCDDPNLLYATLSKSPLKHFDLNISKGLSYPERMIFTGIEALNNITTFDENTFNFLRQTFHAAASTIFPSFSANLKVDAPPVTFLEEIRHDFNSLVEIIRKVATYATNHDNYSILCDFFALFLVVCESFDATTIEFNLFREIFANILNNAKSVSLAFLVLKNAPLPLILASTSATKDLRQSSITIHNQIMSLSYFLLVERNQLPSFIQAIFEIDCMSAAEVVKANYDASKLTDTYFKKINYISSLIISTFQAMVGVKNIEFPIGCAFICEKLLMSNDDRCIDIVRCIIREIVKNDKDVAKEIIFNMNFSFLYETDPELISDPFIYENEILTLCKIIAKKPQEKPTSPEMSLFCFEILASKFNFLIDILSSGVELNCPFGEKVALLISTITFPEVYEWHLRHLKILLFEIKHKNSPKSVSNHQRLIAIGKYFDIIADCDRTLLNLFFNELRNLMAHFTECVLRELACMNKYSRLYNSIKDLLILHLKILKICLKLYTRQYKNLNQFPSANDWASEKHVYASFICNTMQRLSEINASDFESQYIFQTAECYYICVNCLREVVKHLKLAECFEKDKYDSVEFLLNESDKNLADLTHVQVINLKACELLDLVPLKESSAANTSMSEDSKSFRKFFATIFNKLACSECSAAEINAKCAFIDDVLNSRFSPLIQSKSSEIIDKIVQLLKNSESLIYSDHSKSQIKKLLKSIANFDQREIVKKLSFELRTANSDWTNQQLIFICGILYENCLEKNKQFEVVDKMQEIFVNHFRSTCISKSVIRFHLKNIKTLCKAHGPSVDFDIVKKIVKLVVDKLKSERFNAKDKKICLRALGSVLNYFIAKRPTKSHSQYQKFFSTLALNLTEFRLDNSMNPFVDVVMKLCDKLCTSLHDDPNLNLTSTSNNSHRKASKAAWSCGLKQ